MPLILVRVANPQHAWNDIDGFQYHYPAKYQIKINRGVLDGTNPMSGRLAMSAGPQFEERPSGGQNVIDLRESQTVPGHGVVAGSDGYADALLEPSDRFGDP
jgi:hypothetical protein